MKNAAFSCAALALCILFSGCSAARTGPTFPAESAQSESASYSPASFVDSSRKDKSETVYIDASATGEVQKVTVESVLKNPGGTDPVSDISNLTDIKNTEGDEEFTQNGTQLLWQNHGADIHYKGTADASSLPVGVQIEYLLNDRPIEPAQLIGQSGHVTMRFTYQNHAFRTISQGGQNYDVQVPFIAVTLFSLPSDRFYNVCIDNGQILSAGSDILVLGYALPGLADSLCLASYEPAKDFELPESVEVTCDTTDFSLEFTATVFTPGLLADADLEDLNDAEDFIADMQDLQDGVNDLADGTRELNDGVQELADGTSEYTDGVNTVNDAVQQLIDGLRDAAKSDSELIRGANALSGGWIAVLGQFLNFPDLNYENCSERLPAALMAYSDNLYQQQTKSALQSMASSLLSWPTAPDANDLVTIPEEMRPLFGGAETIPAETRQTLALSLFSDSLSPVFCQRILACAVQTLLQQGLAAPDQEQQAAALSAALSSWLANRAALLLSPDIADSSFLEPALTPEESGACASLSGAMADTLASSLLPLVSGTGKLPQSLSDAFNGLADTVDELKEGTQALTDAGADLNDGIRELHDGTAELADAVQDFRNDAIPSLTDLAGAPLQQLINRIRAVQKADSTFSTFGGLPEGKTGSVCFLFETAELTSD